MRAQVFVGAKVPIGADTSVSRALHAFTVARTAEIIKAMPQMQHVLDASKRHPKDERDEFEYGTAGFRMHIYKLDAVVFRVGLLASLRSRNLGGQVVGVMLTASHNPPMENGVKLVDPMGEMLETEWEGYATHLVNAYSDEELVMRYNKLESRLNIDPACSANVILGRDTRPSGVKFADTLKDALSSTGADYTDYGLLTTPQLHYLTKCANTEHGPKPYGKRSEEGYYQKLADAFVKANKGKKFDGSVTVDCANGVGGPKLAEFLKYIPKPEDGGLSVKIINDNVENPHTLNYDCGADHVKTKQRPHSGPRAAPWDRCCSYDGDADRIVYYYKHPEHGFRLLDGDRIATLAASFIGDLARRAGFSSQELDIGVVQTAYANGASTKYIQEKLKLPVVFTSTGVKYLHQAAARFDVGVYFEANGHGTVVFSQKALREFEKEPDSPAQKEALDTLLALTDLINQTVGDALSDMLMVETILAHKVWTCKEWDATYEDLPNCLVKERVADRNMFQTTDAERKLTAPAHVQELIDAEVAKFKEGRSFARPSGTEDVMRVYAEAATRSEADDLANKVAGIIRVAGRGKSSIPVR